MTSLSGRAVKIKSLCSCWYFCCVRAPCFCDFFYLAGRLLTRHEVGLLRLYLFLEPEMYIDVLIYVWLILSPRPSADRHPAPVWLTV